MNIACWRQLGAVFLAGCLVGTVAGAWSRGRVLHGLWRQVPNTEKILTKFDHELSLDDTQKNAVRMILEERRMQVEALHRETSEKFNAIRISEHQAIASLLRPDQKEKFIALVSLWQKRHPALFQGEK